MNNSTFSNRYLGIVTLILAGETIFFLPFVLARVFRPTLLDVFQITNFELGTFYSVYGVVAMVAYFFGGPLADRFSAPKLMSFALATTAAGGLFLSTIPAPSEMKMLYGYWGVTTILLFWAALMRATRKWGGQKTPGLAFGVLDGGRGMVAALVGSAAVVILAAFLPEDISNVTLQQKTVAFQAVIRAVSIFVFLVAFIVRFALPSDHGNPTTKVIASPTFKGFKTVLGMPLIWLQAVIIICAYSGYRVTDDFSLLAKDVLGYNDVDAAKVGTLVLWLRPVAAILAGVLADWVSTSKMMIVSFAFMFTGGVLIGSGIAGPSIHWLIFLAIVTSCLGMFALRGLYFAIMEEIKAPMLVTGTAVGLVSIIGYTPDIYMGPLMGYLLDSSPGVVGHQHVFMLLAGFAVAGMVTAFLLRIKVNRDAKVIA